METLLVEDRGPVRVVTINRPKALNALNEQVVAELTQLIEATDDIETVRGLVLTGAGDKAFVAGADIKEMSRPRPGSPALAFWPRWAAICSLRSRCSRNLPIPVIAAVNGFALGGGCELALACDFIYASEQGQAGPARGEAWVVIPGFGGTQRLARRVGVSKHQGDDSSPATR